MSIQVIKSVAHGVRDVLRVARRDQGSDAWMLFLSLIIFYTMWLAMKPIM